MTSPSPFDTLPPESPRRHSQSGQGRQETENEMDLPTLVSGMRQYLPYIVAVAVLLGGGTYFWSRAQPPVYQTSSSLVTAGNGNLNNLQGALVSATPLPQGALQEALNGPVVLRQVIRGISEDRSLTANIRTDIVTELQRDMQNQKLTLLELTSKLDFNGNGVYSILAKGPTPQAATRLTDLTADALLDWDRGRASSGVRRAQNAFKAQLAEIDRQLAGADLAQLERETLISARATTQRNLAQAGIQLEGITGSLDLVAPAVTPIWPVAPRPTRNAVLVFLLSGLLGLGLAALRAVTDRTARSEDDLLNYGLPTLGSIPRLRKRDVVFSGIVRAARQAGLYEAIGFLRVNLMTRLGSSSGMKGRTVMITSTAPGEGKSSLTATLADGLASSGQRVLIVDADMRRGTQQEVWDKYEKDHRWIQLIGQGGARSLNEALSNPKNVQVMQAEPGVDVLPAGPGLQDSLGVLNRSDVSAAFNLWAQNYDIVLVDSPPLLAIADGLVLGRYMDAVVLVVEEGKTTLQAVQRTIRKAHGSNLNLVGFVLNKVSPNSQESRAYGYTYAYAPRRNGA